VSDNEKISIQLVEVSQQLKATNRRLDEFSGRIEKFEERSQNVIAQMSGIAATCKLHVDQTNAAISTAAEAMKKAENAQNSARQLESSWNDLRRMSRSDSAEYKSISKAINEREDRRQREVESIVTTTIMSVLTERDKAEQERRQQEMDLIFKQNEDKRKEADAKRKKISWVVGLVITIFGALSGMGLWNTYSESKRENRRIIELLHKMKSKDNKHIVSTKPEPPWSE